MEDLTILDENGKEISITDAMQRAIEYYNWIDKIGNKLSKVCMDKIQPLLSEGKFDEAKKEVKTFYKPSNLNDSSVFIERDIIMAKINRLKNY